jgi:hypothetical protein
MPEHTEQHAAVELLRVFDVLGDVAPLRRCVTQLEQPDSAHSYVLCWLVILTNSYNNNNQSL